METKNLNHYSALADIIDYPHAGYHQKVNALQQYLVAYGISVLAVYDNFRLLLGDVSIAQIEELYLRTFAVQAVTTLDIGYVLFGDDYKRGELLVNLSQEHHKAGNDCGHELADNLANLLRLISKTDNEEFKEDLVKIIILPALTKIISEFDTDNIEIKNRVYLKKHKTLIEQPGAYARIFVLPLIIIRDILQADFGEGISEKLEKDTTFTESIVREIKID